MMQAFMSMMGGTETASNSTQPGTEQTQPRPPQSGTNPYYRPAMTNQGSAATTQGAPLGTGGTHSSTTRLGPAGNLPVPVLGSSGTPLGASQTATPPNIPRNPSLQGSSTQGSQGFIP